MHEPLHFVRHVSFHCIQMSFYSKSSLCVGRYYIWLRTLRCHGFTLVIQLRESRVRAQVRGIYEDSGEIIRGIIQCPASLSCTVTLLFSIITYNVECSRPRNMLSTSDCFDFSLRRFSSTFCHASVSLTLIMSRFVSFPRIYINNI